LRSVRLQAGVQKGTRLTEVTLRPATPQDAEALHALVGAHVQEGHLLPRELDEIRRHAARFVVGEREGTICACAELAPLSASVAEVRSLVVDSSCRQNGVAGRLIEELRARARRAGFEALSAFTHDARFFVRQGFSIVPHTWVPAKIATDCLGCPLFRRCGQHAMMLPLEVMARPRLPQREAPRVAVA
jgi:amino-acid N-acetyltransferase